MTGAAAFVRDGRMDILAINSLGRALYSPMYDDPGRPVNIARFHFLDPRARDFFPNWEQAADTTVAIMRTEAGHDPHNRELADLVGELAMCSDEFRTRWVAPPRPPEPPVTRATLPAKSGYVGSELLLERPAIGVI